MAGRERGVVSEEPDIREMARILREATDPKRMAEFASMDRAAMVAREREQEAQRFRAAVDAFKVAYGSAWACPQCAALVCDREQHVRWHDGLAETAQQAANADWRGRPIG